MESPKEKENKKIDYSLKESYDKTIDKWIKILEPKTSNYLLLQITSDFIINHVFEETPIQVIDNDVERTKIDEMIEYENFKKELKKLLNFYF